MTEVQTISAHRILAELKIIGDRINEAATQEFVGCRVGDEGIPAGFKSIEEFEKRAKAKWFSVNDLIKRRNQLKRALIASNAVTIVEIAGVKMTVAEAIDRKDAIEFDKRLLTHLRGQNSNVIRRFEGELRILNQQIDKRIEEASGKDAKVNKEDEENIIKMAEKRYKPHFVDPIKINEQIDKLYQEIREFELEVDIALSESNARTMIEIIA